MVNNFVTADALLDNERYLDGEMMANMVRGGAANLRSNAREVNDLNVFPVPDGDTGDNMSMTMEGGVAALEGVDSTNLADVMAHISQGMLLGARGNSGVILSQFFAGMNKGFTDCDKADAHIVGAALEEGVKQAYSSVITPTEGTILTVAREAVEYAVSRIDDDTTIPALFSDLTTEMYASLQRTPEILEVLKEAGVIDSGGAGLFYIMLGFSKILQGEEIEAAGAVQAPKAAAINLNAFGPDSEMTYGYCTEMLLRLQNAKVDIAAFDVSVIIDYLSSIGDSIVCVKNDSIVKLHVHTMTPGNVLTFCQQFGEALTVKIENMNVQHSEAEENTPAQTAAPAPRREKPAKGHGTVAVASGDGIADLFRQLGVDAVVSGGQTQNPSAQDFLSAFEEVGAKHIYVFPNNGNIVMAAKQAGQLYDKGEVHVIESKDLGQGYAAISSLNFQSDDAELIAAQLTEAMGYVKTGSVSTSIRDAELNGVHIETGDFIGFMGKEMLVSRKELADAAEELLIKMGLDTGEVYMVTAFTGSEAPAETVDALTDWMAENYPDVEFYTVEGGQEVYPFIFVVE
ncbi:MAG: DAK2 domain-containing protein [Ruminococcaceae bacterium]|nr:DAK2 domain-containing protein [Oscillospiraceae bacterium]